MTEQICKSCNRLEQVDDYGLCYGCFVSQETCAICQRKIHTPEQKAYCNFMKIRYDKK